MVVGVLLGVIVLALISVGVYFAFFNKPKPVTSEKPVTKPSTSASAEVTPVVSNEWIPYAYNTVYPTYYYPFNYYIPRRRVIYPRRNFHPARRHFRPRRR